MNRRIDEDIDELIDAWEQLHPSDEEERDPAKPRRGQAGADYVFMSMTRYRIGCPGTR